MIRSMPRPVLSLSLFAALAACAVPSASLADVTLYIGPDGNDAWSGKLAEPNADKSDGPLATPARARDAARATKTQKVNGPITVVLRGGTYFLPEPLTLTEADSGTEKSPVTWSAFPGESPVLSAGRRIAGWQKTTVNGRDAWIARLPIAGEGTFWFRELWVNGHRAVRARWPKHGTFAVAETSKAKTHAEWRHPESEFPFHEGDVLSWPTAADGEAVLTSRWTEARLPISSIDPAVRVLHSSKLAGFHPETDDRFYIENVKECLTEPGEWYLDPRENAVYLIPPAGVTSPNDAEVIAPVLPQVLRLAGDIAGKHWIEHIAFREITFAHSEWYFDHVAPGEKPDPSRTGFNQASVGVPGAVWGEGVRSCTFDHCTIAHVGGFGIELGRACQHNHITHCTITDLAGGGIKIGEPVVRDNVDQQTFGNEVSDCRITDGGNLFPSSVGVWIGQSHDNTLAHNEIAHFLYTGISVGWTWGYGKALSQNNLIEDNEIHHIGIKQDGDDPILSDMGGIYTLANEKGTIIRHNSFHDIAALKYGGWGIYFDEGTTDILAENNLVYRTTHAGFHQHYGKDNIVRNNIFALGRDAQIQRTRLEDHRSFSFENNIVYWKAAALLAGRWDKLNVAFDHNLYWRAGGGDILFGKLTWPQWRAAGMDRDSVIADPGFRDADHGDFHFVPNVKGIQSGFVPFELTGFGPRP